MLAEEENFAGLARINRELIGKAEAAAPARRIVLDMDSTDIPVHGRQEQSAYNGHFKSTCYDPLLLFDRGGDCLAAKLRPGNVHSAEGWEEMLLPEDPERTPRQRKQAKQVVFRADAAFAKPELYQVLEERGVNEMGVDTWGESSINYCRPAVQSGNPRLRELDTSGPAFES